VQIARIVLTAVETTSVSTATRNAAVAVTPSNIAASRSTAGVAIHRRFLHAFCIP
jgi:hypothetical protein